MISTKELGGFLPHEGEMVWVDSVVSPGVCLIKADKKKHYFSEGVVRQSAYIEWIAQAYGFSMAYEQHLLDQSHKLCSAYLVSFNKAKFSHESILDQDEIIVEVSLIKKMDEISAINGKIYSSDKGILYCEATVKVFSE